MENSTLNPIPPINPGRRDFLKKAGLSTGLMAFPGILAAQSPGQETPLSRLNVAIVGVGGKGVSNLQSVKEENIIALCDVDMGRVNEAMENDPEFAALLQDLEARGAKWYRDYREMLVDLGDRLDAVVISTPDHMHYPIALSAIRMGKHVYVEKPLTHTVEEARLLTMEAAKAGVVTQMGNQGHSNAATRLVKEWIEAGVIGPVREVHSWTNRPVWPQGQSLPDHSKMIPVVPDTLDWNLWLGIAEPRAYDPAYLPFGWRGWWDFGCGAFGDMACHIMDAPFWALQLDKPAAISSACTEVTEFSAPKASVVTYEFPARGKFPELVYKWYDGGLRPTLPDRLAEWPQMVETNGTFIIGEEAVMVVDTYGKSIRVLPDEKFSELRAVLPPKTLPRVKGGHMEEWLNAIRENRPASSDFSYAGPFTEMALLGNVAIRSGRRIQYDSDKMEITNFPEANRFLKKDYRPGWIL